MKKREISAWLAIFMITNMTVPVMAVTDSDGIIKSSSNEYEHFENEIDIDGDEEKVSNMEPFILDRNPKFSEYRAVMEIQREEIESVATNGGHYYRYTPENAIDGNNSTFWETKIRNSSSFTNEFTVEFKELEEIAKMTYRIRSSLTGFLNEYEIYGSKTSDGDDFELITTGRGSTTSGTVEINFDPTEVKRVKIVFVKANNDWASIAELDFYRPDPLMEEITRVFADNLYTVLSEEYDTIEEIEALEEQVLLHPYKDDYMSTINLAKDILNGVEVERSDIYTLSQRGDENADKARIRKRYAGGNLDLTGYYIMPGETIEVYVDADENGVLPQVVFAQVGVAEIDDNFRTDLEPGKNVVGAPVDYTQPFAVYFANKALPEDQEYAPRVTIKGDNLQEYPIYIDGVTDPEEYIEEVKNHTGANMTDLIGEKFLISARNSEAQIAYVENGASPLDLAREMNNLTDIFNDISGLYEDDENPIHRPSQALNHVKFTNLSGIYAGNEFTHSTTTAARVILAGNVYGWAMLHEYAHQLEGVGLMQSEITTNIYSVAASQVMGIDLGYRFDARQKDMDSFLVNGDSEGYSDFDYHEKLTVLYQVINYFGIDIYTEAFRTVREDWSVYPSSVAVQAIVAAFSEKTGYDLSSHFELYNYPLTDETKEYTSQFKPLDIKLEYTVLDAYDMINDNVELFTDETKAVINGIEKVEDGFKLTLSTSDENEGTTTYEIYRDGELVGIARDNEYIDPVDLSDIAKTYEYEVVAYDYRVNNSVKSDKVIAAIDGTPTIEVDENIIIELNEEFNPLDYVTAISHDYTEISKENIQVIKNEVDNTKEGLYEVVYEVDNYGFKATKTMNVQVVTRYDYISDMNWVSGTTGYKSITKDRTVTNLNKLKVNVDGDVTEFNKGIGTVANSEIVYDVSGLDYDYFTTYVGPDENESYSQTSFVASIIVDGEEVYKSELFKNNSEADFVKIALDGVSEIKLVAYDNGDGITGDFVAWADSRFIYNKEENESIVTYELNGGAGVRAQKVVNGESPVLSQEPTRSGYLFAGWYADSQLVLPVELSELTVEEDITLYAKWNVARTLSFNLNGGTGNIPAQVIAVGGNPVRPSEDPTKEGYKFIGWYMDGNLTKPMIFETFTVSKNGTIFAKWAEASTVTFELNGGEGSFESQLVINGESPVVTEEPTKEGYIFDGWYSDSNFETQVDPSGLVIEEDTTIYAKWLRVDTVTFELNGGEGNFPNQEVIEGETLTVIEEPIREGYIFDGWYKDNEFTTQVELSGIEILEDTTFYAKWLRVDTVIFELNGGEGNFPNQEVIEGETLTVIEEPIREGYIFDGWYTDNEFTTQVELSGVEILEDTTFYAKWLRVDTVIFELNGGEGNFPSQEVIEGETLTIIEEPTREGYIFDGWYTDNEFTTQIELNGVEILEDTTFYAKWLRVEYDYVSDMVWKSGTTGYKSITKDKAVTSSNKLKLNLDGVVTEFDKGIGTVADSEIVYDISDLGYDYFTSYIGPDENYHYTKTSIIFKVIVDGEEVYESSLFTNNSEAEFIKIPVDGASEVKLVVHDNDDGILGDFATWADAKFIYNLEENESLVSFDLTGGQGMLSQKVTNGESPIAKGEPSRSGYLFNSWYSDSELTTQVELDELVIEEDTTIYAKWDTARILSFNLNGGEGDFPAQTIILGGSPIKPTEEPTKEGYRFVGWYMDGNLTNPMIFEDFSITRNGSVFAKWIKVSIVTFELNGGDGSFETQEILEGETLTVTEEPTREGYIFDGWYADSQFTTSVELNGLEVEEDTTFYAKWLRVDTVTFELNGGEGNFPSQEVIEGETLTITEDPTREGYIFDGWYGDSEFITPVELNELVIEGDTTFYAKWLRINTVTFELNGGEGNFPSQEVIEGEILTVTEEPTRSGYLFNSWYLDSELTIQVDLNELEVQEDITLYAKWDVARTLTFNLNGGEGNFPPQIIAVGSNPIEPTEIPTKEGYIFGGWYINSRLTMPMIFESWIMKANGATFAKWIAEN